jgi:hypothetical protein
MVRQHSGHDGLLAVEAAPLGLAVTAVSVDDVVLGDVPQPQMKGHGRVFQIIGQAAMCFEKHVLHDVAGIDARRQGRIEAQTDDAPQRLAVNGQQMLDGLGFSLPGSFEQWIDLGLFGPHGVCRAGDSSFKRQRRN